MFRAIYKAMVGAAIIKGAGGMYTFSKSFDIARGVIQGDIIRPTFFNPGPTCAEIQLGSI